MQVREGTQGEQVRVVEGETSVGAKGLFQAGTVLGFGLGGFFDGIVLHQVLQWHHMVSNRHAASTLAGLQFNTLADGVFHLATYSLTILGIVLLWRVGLRAGRPLSRGRLLGAVLVGFGSFHVFDEVMNHRLLGLHHIKPGPNELVWDLGFFALGLVLISIGLLMWRRAGVEQGGYDEQ